MLLAMQVPNYADLPPRAEVSVERLCTKASDRIHVKLNSYHAWVRRMEYSRGGRLMPDEAVEYRNEASMAMKPYLALIHAVPFIDGAHWGECFEAENEADQILQNIAGERFGASHGYEQRPDGTWERVR